MMPEKFQEKFKSGSIPEEKLREHHMILLSAISNEEAKFNNQELAEFIDVEPSTASTHLSKLTDSGYIEKYNDGFNNYYELRRRGKNALRGGGNNFKLIDRGHKLVYTFSIFRQPKEGFDKTQFYVNKDMTNWSEQLTKKEESGIVIHVNDNSSITVKVKGVRADSPESVAIVGYEIAERVILELMEDHPNLVVGEPEGSFVSVGSLCDEHHAIEKEPFSRLCADFNIHYKRSDTKGSDTRGRIEIDQSHGTPEIEFVDSKSAQEDFNRYKEFILDLLRGNITLEALNWITENLNKMKRLTSLDIDSLEKDYSA